MRTSEQLTTLLGALVLARKDFKPITKDATGVVGKDHPYKYADLSGILEAIIPACLTNGLVILQSIDAETSSLTTRVAHVSGEWVECVYPLPSTTSAQAFGSALTYGRRYSIQSLLCLAAADDDGAVDVPPARKSKPAKASGKAISNPQRLELWKTAERAGWNTVQFKNYLEKTVGIRSSADVLETQYDDLLTVFGTPFEPEGDTAP
jgi:hypothetical protein